MKKSLLLAVVLLSLRSFSQNGHPYFLGRTLAPLPFLEYGIGDDRLGGAKMTFLDSNVLLKVVDSFKTKYQVQLSRNHFAYVDKKNLVRDSLAVLKTHLTNNWKVFGDSAYDYELFRWMKNYRTAGHSKLIPPALWWRFLVPKAIPTGSPS